MSIYPIYIPQTIRMTAVSSLSQIVCKLKGKANPNKYYLNLMSHKNRMNLESSSYGK